MQRRQFIKTSFVAMGITQAPGILFDKSNDLPNVLILGDSISMGYTKYVQELLKGKANVTRPMDASGKVINCEGTTKGIAEIDNWLGDTRWNVIHFNFGLHDLKHVDPVTGENSTKPEDPQQADLEQYKKNLKFIVDRLKKTDATLIFATTTPFPNKPQGPLRRADQPAKYNAVALKIMKKNDIEINDLYAFCLPRLAELQLPNNVHFKPEGSEVIARLVADKISEVLKD